MSETYVVKQGDCLYRIASRFGFADWHAIYDHPDNADFRKKRPNPNVIFPGDLLKIPDKGPKSVDRPTGGAYKFEIKVLKIMLRVIVKDEDGEPLAGKKWELAVDSGTYKGTTTGEGIVEQAVPQSDEAGDLTVFLTDDEKAARYTWNVRIGHLDPVEEIVGVQERLNNLGFYCGEADGEADDELTYAVRGFQDVAGLDKTGEIDDAFRAKLVEMHGKM